MFAGITGKTKLIGLLATPISHSISPLIHNAAFNKLGLDYAYIAFECNTEQLADAVKGFRTLNIRGFNLSMPNKTEILKYLDRLSPAAKLSNSVNTVVNENGILTGYNTDGTGYMRSLKEEGIDIIGKKMTILGAGGAATAIVVQAAIDGIKEISIFNRKGESFRRTEIIVKHLNDISKCKAKIFDVENKEKLRAEIENSTILTNATPLGMKPLEDLCSINDATMLRTDLIVSDLVYIPEKSMLLKMAESKGCKIINGLGMLLWQGAEAFELWTGEKMPVEYVKGLIKK